MFYSGEGFHCIMIYILYTILKPRESQEQVTIHPFFNLASKFYRKKFEHACMLNKLKFKFHMILA